MPRNPWTKAADADLQRLCAKGASTRSIALEMGRSRHAVDRRIGFLREKGLDVASRVTSAADAEPDPDAFMKACNLHLHDLIRAHPERMSP